MKLFILLLLLLSACGQPPLPTETSAIPSPLPPKPIPTTKARVAQDATLEPLIIDFQNRYGRDTSQIYAYLTFDNPNFDTGIVEGYCDGAQSIWIDPYYFNNDSDLLKMALVYHELGHCVLRRPHLDTTYPDGCPISIMSTYLVTQECIVIHKDEMLAELIKGW